MIHLKRPLGPWLVHDLEFRSGGDTISLSAPSDIELTVDPHWHTELAEDGHPVLVKGGTLVVVDTGGGLRVGLVDDLILEAEHLTVVAGGVSMISKDYPWEAPDRELLGVDPVDVFRDIWAQIQSHPRADLGIEVTGDTSSGGAAGRPGSSAWQAARREAGLYQPQVDTWTGRMLTRERLVQQRAAELTKAAGLKRVGTITDTEQAPEDPGYRADSTVWVRESTGRAHVWKAGRWVSQSQADAAVVAWRTAVNSKEVGSRYLEAAQYRLAPALERLKELEEADEGPEPFELSIYATPDLSATIGRLAELGPFEWVESAEMAGEDLRLSLQVSAPRRSRRREDVWLELGENVHEMPDLDSGEPITDVLAFGAGHGSATPRTHLTIPPGPRVRRFSVVTDNDSYTRSQLKTFAAQHRDQLRRQAEPGFRQLIVHDSPQTPIDQIRLGDVVWVRGALSDNTDANRRVRITSISREWWQGTVSLTVEPE